MLKFFNTLTRKIEEFRPIKKRKVGLYSCGPTVYDFIHIGNYRAYVSSDLLKRYLEYLGFKVKHVMNITDVDDKTIRDSQKAKKTLKEFTDFYLKFFLNGQQKREIISKNKVSSCYFRSSVELPYRKALLQITERCNLRCAHCFISAGNYGDTMPIGIIRNVVIPKLKDCRVVSVTLTGGEPFIHPDIIEMVRLFKNANIRVGICTNGTPY